MFILSTFSCDQSDVDIEKAWNNAINDYDKGRFSECVVKLNVIAEKYYDSSFAPKSYYLISEIYLNEYKQYDIAISFLNQILTEYPTSAENKKSLFTLGYVYANYTDSYTDANYYYKEFIKKYPNDDLIPSVQYELENLKPLIDKSDSLINLK